ncbi:5'-nucleotidase C-terminal domain-containing protein [Oscillibacter sp.]|uniref:5'-nucleotidase C-terminal domain-containing protein n=1 Tax=Oscillibacter sp. TaxID=1945593 RepID=UPI003391038F
MKKVISLLLAAVMAMSLTTVSFAADTTAVDKGDIVVLYTNDVHCGVDDNIGYAGLAAYKAEMQKATDYVTLADVGDAVQGAALGTLSKGEYIVDIMNQMGYDVAVPGNHEFDYGMDQFLNLSKEMKCGYVCCNFMDLRTNKPVFDAYKMITYGNTKVAYVGIDTPESITKSTPTYFQDNTGKYIYGFCNGNNGKELYNAVQSAVDSAKAAGANYVIAVGHCGIDEQSAPWRSTDIIANVSGLTAFLDGHSHSTIPSQKVSGKDGKTVLLTSTGTKLAAIGKLVLKSSGAVTTELVTDYTAKNPAMDTFVKGIQSKNEALLNKVVAKTSVDLTTIEADGKTRAIRNQETNLGDLVADAYRDVAGADIAIVNGGGIRADIKAGDITYGQIIAVHPFGNELRMVEATGQQILDALEMSARSTPDENGGFLQVSGLTYTIDTSIPSTVKTDDNKMFVSVTGARRVKDVKVGGVAIVATKTYKLASHNYMLESAGDGLNMFQKDKFLAVPAMLDNQILINFITGTLKGTVPAEYTKAQGRITITGVVMPYTDVVSGSYYYDAVLFSEKNSLIPGTSATTFSPNVTMTRGDVVLALWNLAGKPAAKATPAFTDVDFTTDLGKAVAWANENSIVNGKTATTFVSGDSVNRQQFASFMFRYAEALGYSVSVGGSLGAFTDASQVSSYATKAMVWANGNSLVNGFSDNTVRPFGTATRGQSAAIIYRFASTLTASKAA